MTPGPRGTVRGLMVADCSLKSVDVPQAGQAVSMSDAMDVEQSICNAAVCNTGLRGQGRPHLAIPVDENFPLSTSYG